VTLPSPSHDNDPNDDDKDDEQDCSTSSYCCDHCDTDTVASAVARCDGRLVGRLTYVHDRHIQHLHSRSTRAVFVRFSLGGQSFDWRLATTAGIEVAKLVPWNSLLHIDHVGPRPHMTYNVLVGR